MKRKIVSDEITDVQKKKAHLQESINDLIKDADKLAFEAETKNDLELLGRSNDLQKISRTKKRARWFKKDWGWAFVKNWNLYVNIGKALKHWRWNKFRKACYNLL